MTYSGPLIICGILYGFIKLLGWVRPNLVKVSNILSYIVLICSTLIIFSLPVPTDSSSSHHNKNDNSNNSGNINKNHTNIIIQWILKFIIPSNGKEDEKLISISSFLEEINDTHITSVHHVMILRKIKGKFHSNEFSIQEAVEKGILQRILISLSNLPVNDLRLPLSFDIINEIFNGNEFVKVIEKDKEIMKDIVLELISATKFINQGFEMDSGIDLDDVIESDVISIADEEKRKEEKKNSRCFLLEKSNAHKAILSIGLLATKSTIAQSLLGDYGAIDILNSCLRDCKESSKISIWCIWSLINLTFQHPPNKRDYFIKDGIQLTLNSMKCHQDELEMIQQGFALLYSVLSPELKGKFNLHTAKSQALTYGIIDLVYYVQKKFKTEKDLMATIQVIQEEIFKDWS